MKVVVLHRYFWPQPYPYARMLKDIVETLATEHGVSVLTTDSGNLNEKDLRQEWSVENKITIKALPLASEKKASIIKKSFNSLYFGVWAFFILLTKKTDVVMVATTPPIIIAMIVRWVSYFRKFKYIYHCQDIHPEAMLLSKNIKKGLKYKLLLHIDKKNIDQAWKVITLSEDMKETLAKRRCKTSNIHVINNFVFESASDFSFIKSKEKKITFLFAGSLGRLQNLKILMSSLVLLKHRKDIQFIFMGDGIMLNEMKRKKEEHNLDNVEFLGQRSFQEAVKAMQMADFGIVSIASNISRVAYPSKTMMYLGNSLPIFALVDKNTEIYNFINEKKIGKAVVPTTSEEIAKSIESFVDRLNNCPINRDHVRNIAEDTFGKQVILPKFLGLYS